MRKQYVVIARCFGDGEISYGERVWSQTFNTRRAAEGCSSWLGEHGVEAVVIIEDEAA